MTIALPRRHSTTLHLRLHAHRLMLPAAVGGALLLLLWLAVLPRAVVGDGTEYIAMLRALWEHGTPALASKPPAGAFFQARTGDWYSYHFWAYSLSALPANALMNLVQRPEYAALRVTNGLWFLLALGVTLRSPGVPMRRRVIFVALATITPAIWYLAWTGPEVMTWAGIVIALALLDRRRYPLAALAAAVAALQNPPVLALIAVIGLAALATRHWRTIALTALAGSLALLPNMFYMALFGTPNLIAKVGLADPRLMSAGRIWSVVTDLNQGLLPYVPGLLMLAAVGLGMTLWRRDWLALAVGGALLAMIALDGMTPNWNSDGLGLMRYAVWLTPLLAWLAARAFPATRGWMRILLVALAVDLGLLCQLQLNRAYLREQPLAAAVLRYAPALYNPEPEIFAERSRQQEGDYRATLPLAFVAEDGGVTKVLLDATSLDLLATRYQVDPAYLAAVRQQHEHDAGLFYLTPPPGMIRAAQ